MDCMPLWSSPIYLKWITGVFHFGDINQVDLPMPITVLLPSKVTPHLTSWWAKILLPLVLNFSKQLKLNFKVTWNVNTIFDRDKFLHTDVLHHTDSWRALAGGCQYGPLSTSLACLSSQIKLLTSILTFCFLPSAAHSRCSRRVDHSISENAAGHILVGMLLLPIPFMFCWSVQPYNFDTSGYTGRLWI